jgi:hypothetical protein
MYSGKIAVPPGGGGIVKVAAKIYDILIMYSVPITRRLATCK